MTCVLQQVTIVALTWWLASTSLMLHVMQLLITHSYVQTPATLLLQLQKRFQDPEPVHKMGQVKDDAEGMPRAVHSLMREVHHSGWVAGHCMT